MSEDGELEISNCYGRGTVIGIDANNAAIGGLVGQIIANGKVKILDCYHVGKVDGTIYSGGVIGIATANNQVSISNCYHEGIVKSTGKYTGGVIGQANVSSESNALLTIENCYNTGTVTGTERVGGVIGYANAVKNTLILSKCMNNGKINGTGQSVGGIVGYESKSRNGTLAITNCYYLTGCAVDGNGTLQYGIGHYAKGSTTPDVEGQTIGKTEAQFQSGEVAYLLQQAQEEDSETGTIPQVWYQNIDNDGTKDTHPVLDSTHGKVYQCTPCTGVYSNMDGKKAEHILIYKDDTKHICKNCGSETEHSASTFTADMDNKTVTGICVCGTKCGTFTLTAPSDDTLTYDGTAKEATVTGAISGVTDTPTINYFEMDETGEEKPLADGAKPTDAGRYKAGITCGTGEGAVTVSVNYTVEKAEPTVAWSETDKTLNYTGSAISDETLESMLTITSGGEFEYDGESKYLYSYRKKDSQDAFKDGLPADIGEYEIKAEIAEQDNYKAASSATADLTIDWLDTDTEAVFSKEPNVSGTDQTQGIRLTAPEGFEISYEMDNAYTSSITYDTETDENGKELTYYLKNSDGELAKRTVTVYIDKTAPRLTDITTPSESGGTLTQTGADISFKSDESGTYYYVVRKTEQKAPAADEFFKQSEKDGYTVWSAKDGILCAQMSANGTNKVTLDGLTENTSYTLYVLLLDDVGNASDVYKKAFSTPEKEEIESSEPESETASESETETSSEPETETSSEPESESETSSEPESETESETSSEPESSDDDSDFSDGNEKLEVTISNIKAKVYDQNAYEPTVKVTVTQTVNGRKKKVTLTEGGDYSVSYKDNVNAGTGKVIITGEGDYKGVAEKEFTIAKKSVKKLKIAAGSISGDVNLYDLSALPVYVYDGTACLRYGTDYKFTDCTAAKNGKTAQVTVEGLGNYTGTSKIKLKIYDSSKIIISPENVKVLDENPVYTGKAVTPEIEVTVDGTVLTEKTDYTVKYANNKEAGTAYVTVTGKGSYAGEAAVPFMIKACEENELTISDIKAVTYKGKLQKPSVSVSIQKDGKVKKLIKYKDYKVTYANNFHAGEATVTITGKGNYAGLSGEKTFKINPVEIKKASVKGTLSTLVLTYAKRTLKEGKDYTTEYGEEKSGKAAVTIKGNGDFTGTVVKKVKLF